MHVAPTITWAIFRMRRNAANHNEMDRCEKMTQVVDVHESMAIHGWNKANIYYIHYLDVYVHILQTIYMIQKCWQNPRNDKPAQASFFVDVKQYSVWQFALRAPNKFLGTLFGCIVSQHKMWRCCCLQHISAYLYILYICKYIYIDSWWYLIICVCACTGCIASVLVFRQLVPHKPEHTWSHESKGKQAKQSRQAIFKVHEYSMNQLYCLLGGNLPFGWGQCIVHHVVSFFAIT